MTGDLSGFSRWTIGPAARGAHAVFEEDVLAEKSLRRLAVVARPASRANHTLMMRHSPRGLRTHLAACRAATASSDLLGSLCTTRQRVFRASKPAEATGPTTTPSPTATTSAEPTPTATATTPPAAEPTQSPTQDPRRSPPPRRGSYDHSEVLYSQVTVLNSASALYRAAFSRRRSDGGEISRLTVTHLVTGGPVGRRISAPAVHGPDP